MGDNSDQRSLASRFGSRRAPTIARPVLKRSKTDRELEALDLPIAPLQLVPRPPNPNLGNPFAPRAWRPRRPPDWAKAVRRRGVSHPWAGDDSFAEDDLTISAQINPKHAKSTQDELWAKAREPLVTQYYASAQVQQQIIVDGIEDRVTRLRIEPRTCGSCHVHWQAVTFICLHGVVEVPVPFTNCTRCAARMSCSCALREVWLCLAPTCSPHLNVLQFTMTV